MAKTGDSYFVVASKGGAPEHPGWYRNILANPDVEVQVGTAKMKARASTATGEERARLWEKSLEFWPPYADYQTQDGARDPRRCVGSRRLVCRTGRQSIAACRLGQRLAADRLGRAPG